MVKTVSSTLTPIEGAAWSGFLRAHALITRRLDADLRASAGLTLSEFEILLHLAAAGGELRMAQIAHDVVLTGGGVTRIVARLEALGLITRRSCPQDRRGIFAVLTRSGWARQRAAQKVHVDGVRRLFLREVSEAELAALGRRFGRMIETARVAPRDREEACALEDRKAAGPRTRKIPLPV
jgi:DNA-binding MarR family transcriptional regulator